MKRIAAALLVTFLPLLLCFFQRAICHAEDAIPARYTPILEDWNATTAEELRLNIIDFWARSIRRTDAENDHYTPEHYPLNIRFGGTTQELIADQQNWDLAVVSSKDVDLQTLADKGLIESVQHYPDDPHALHQWLLPEHLQAKLPQDRLLTYYVYVYDYDERTDDATLLLCRANAGDDSCSPNTFASAMMWKRSATIARNLEGIRLLPDLAVFLAWTEDELLARADEWDVAVIRVKEGDNLERLDQAGLLYDFSQNDYFASRTPIKPYEAGMPNNACLEFPIGVFSADGRNIGIPFADRWEGDDVGLLILNAKSPSLERAMAYAVHFIKSKEYSWTAEFKDWPHAAYGDICIYKDEMDW
jgi:hypothetical protein